MIETTHISNDINPRAYTGEGVVRFIHEYGLDVQSNHIFLFEEEAYAKDDQEAPGVEYLQSSKFIKNLNILMRKSTAPILVHMKSQGGDWEQGMAIFDAIAACPNHVTILCYGNASSMSGIILQAADKRVMFPHSLFMFHRGTSELSGSVKVIQIEYGELKRELTVMRNIFVKAIKDSKNSSLSNWSTQRIENWIIDRMDKKEDVYLSSEEALKYGFCDEVFGKGKHGYDWGDLVSF